MKRVGIAILMGLSVLAMAGCGSDAPKDTKAMHQEATAREKEDATAHAKWFAEGSNVTKALEALKARPELKGDLRMLDNVIMDMGTNTITVDVVKPGTKDVYRYVYNVADKAWQEGQKVELVGPGKATATDYAYDINKLNVANIGKIMAAYEKKAEADGKDAYIGFISKVTANYDQERGAMIWKLESMGGTAYSAGKQVTALLDNEANVIDFKANIDKATVEAAKAGAEGK